MSAGYRSPAGVWIGGISQAPSIQKAGYRSLLAFWMGGASASVIIPPTPPTPIITRREPDYWGPSYVIWSDDMYYKRQRREEEEIIIL